MTLNRLLATVLCGLFAGALAGPGPGFAVPAIQVSEASATPGRLDLTVMVSDLPQRTDLAGAEVAVRVRGQELPVRVRTGRASASPDATAGRDAVRSVVVVFDASRSMVERGALGAARAAASEYARALPADVRLGLVAVSDRPDTLTPPTTDRKAFTTALRRITARGDTALYDAVGRAVSLLPPGERRIVVLSDGEDTASDSSLKTLTTTLRKQLIPTDVVALGRRTDRAALRLLTEASGGRLFEAGDVGALTAAFQQAAQVFTARLLVTVEVPESLASQSAPVRVEVAVAGRRLATTVDVKFAGSTALPVPTGGAAASPATSRPLLSWLVAGFVFLALFVVVLLVANPVLVGAPARRRVAQVNQYVTGQPVPVPGSVPGAVARTALAWSDRAVQLTRQEQRAVHKLDRAGMSLRPGEWLLLRVCVVVTAVVVLWLLLPWWAGIPLGLLTGSLGTLLYRRIRTRLRIRRFNEQLPDALQLVIGSLRSGFSLAQALAAVVRESTDPLSTELGRALAETRLGSELEDALARVVSRTDSDDLAWAVMSVRIQREVGGNLAEVLQTAVDTMRERGRLRRHVKALSAEGRLSAYILVGLPILLFTVMLLFRREYLAPLYTTALGIVMLVFATLLMTVGGFVMSRLVKVEV
jgi:tight adherence protein B